MLDSATNMAIMLAPIIKSTIGEQTIDKEFVVNCAGGLLEPDKKAFVANENGQIIPYKEYLEAALSGLVGSKINLNICSETRGVATLCATRINMVATT